MGVPSYHPQSMRFRSLLSFSEGLVKKKLKKERFFEKLKILFFRFFLQVFFRRIKKERWRCNFRTRE